jgi:antitoxin HigA-1
MVSGVFVLFGAKAMHTMSRSLTITEESHMNAQKLPPIHPGEILLEEYLKPMEISQYRLAKEISVSARRINEIVHGKRAISADTALRLARFFGTTELFWVNLQTRYDMEVEKDRLSDRLEREVSIFRGTGSWNSV